jgi:hypothetical protein
MKGATSLYFGLWVDNLVYYSLAMCIHQSVSPVATRWLLSYRPYTETSLGDRGCILCAIYTCMQLIYFSCTHCRILRQWTLLYQLLYQLPAHLSFLQRHGQIICVQFDQLEKIRKETFPLKFRHSLLVEMKRTRTRINCFSTFGLWEACRTQNLLNRKHDWY